MHGLRSAMTQSSHRFRSDHIIARATTCRYVRIAACSLASFGRVVRGVESTDSPSPTLVTVSRFVADIRQAVRDGRLPKRFRPRDVRRACPGWADHTYGVFLPKHRKGDPGRYTAYFEQHKRRVVQPAVIDRDADLARPRQREPRRSVLVLGGFRRPRIATAMRRGRASGAAEWSTGK